MQSKVKPAHPQTAFWKIVQFPLTRIILAALFVMLGVILTQAVAGFFGTSASSPLISMLIVALALTFVYLSYRLYVGTIELRPLKELSLSRALTELSAGLLAGFGLVAAVIGILWQLRVYQVTETNPWLVLIPVAVADIPSGFVQEILFRGILFRITEESLGSWGALVISAVLFGLVHIFSVNATLVSTLSIMLEAGLLLGAAYILTGRLWLVIGLHIAWDFTIDGIFGVGASGLSDKPLQGLLQARLVGMDLLTGGAHGVEASVVAVLVALLAGCFLIWLAWRRKKFVTPARMRTPE
jgi:CAAX protease family protein